jgi:asparagine synthase (glutamine-hydrolysing)
VGGDELLGSYSTFRTVPRLVGALRWAARPKMFGVLARRLAGPRLPRALSPKYAGLIEYGGTYGGAYLLVRALHMPWELDDLLDERTLRDGFEELDLVSRINHSVAHVASAHARVAALEMLWYMRNQLLRDTDWASMAHSLEIRVPLVDARLFAQLACAIVSECWPTKDQLTAAVTLLPEVVGRPKTGFTTPVREWIHSSGREPGLRPWAQRVLADARTG